MVAVVIVALTLPALLFTLSQHIDGTAYIRDRSLARLVASNRLAELRLALRTGGQSLAGRVSGREEMAGREWFWSIDSEETELPGFSRVQLEVRIDEDPGQPPLYTLTALLAITDGEDGGA